MIELNQSFSPIECLWPYTGRPNLEDVASSRVRRPLGDPEYSRQQPLSDWIGIAILSSDVKPRAGGSNKSVKRRDCEASPSFNEEGKEEGAECRAMWELLHLDLWQRQALSSYGRMS